MAGREPQLAEHFEGFEQQDYAGRLGMWIFVCSEALLFAGLFALYVAYRQMYGEDFVAAVSHNDITLGTINTFILASSSFAVAFAVHAARSGKARQVIPLIGLGVALGVVFLVVKGIEYRHHFSEGIYPGTHYAYDGLQTYGAQIFFTLYYLLTGLHLIHLVAGLFVLLWLARRHRARAYTPEHHLSLELGSLYWHLVDLMWIFLWPLLYLMR